MRLPKFKEITIKVPPPEYFPLEENINLNKYFLDQLPITPKEKKQLEKIYQYFNWQPDEVITERELIIGLIYLERKENNLSFIDRLKTDTAEEIATAMIKILDFVEKNIIQPLPKKVFHLTDYNIFNLPQEELSKLRLFYLHNKHSKH